EIVVGVPRAQVAAQAPAVEYRQQQRGAGLRNPAVGGQQLAVAHRLQADERSEVDVGVELRLGRIDVASRGLDPPALRDDVGAPAEQVRGERRRKRYRAGLGARARDREAAVRTLAHERGELVARECDVFLELRDALARRGDRSLGLLQLDPGVEARSESLAG